MDPIANAKSALNVSYLIKLLVGIWLVFLVLDFFGLSTWIFAPWKSIQARFPSLAKFGN